MGKTAGKTTRATEPKTKPTSLTDALAALDDDALVGLLRRAPTWPPPPPATFAELSTRATHGVR
jgi:hypothetical protein